MKRKVNVCIKRYPLANWSNFTRLRSMERLDPVFIVHRDFWYHAHESSSKKYLIFLWCHLKSWKQNSAGLLQTQNFVIFKLYYHSSFINITRKNLIHFKNTLLIGRITQTTAVFENWSATTNILINTRQLKVSFYAASLWFTYFLFVFGKLRCICQTFVDQVHTTILLLLLVLFSEMSFWT